MPSGSDGPFSTRGVGMDAKHASFASGPADHAMHLICKPIHAAPQDTFIPCTQMVEDIIAKVSIDQYPHCTRADLREIGHVGYVEVQERYNVRYGSFERYAKIFIQGRIVNYLFSL